MSRYDGLIIPRSYSEYINKTDAATLQQALQLSGVLSAIVAAGDNKAVKSSAVYEALTNYINKTDAATLQQALQLPGVLSGAVAAEDNKAVKSSAVNNALNEYINKTDAATIQQALQLPGVLSEAVAAGDNKAVKSSAVNKILREKRIGEIYNSNGYWKVSLIGFYARPIVFKCIGTSGLYDIAMFGLTCSANLIRLGNTSTKVEYKYTNPPSSGGVGYLFIKSNIVNISHTIFSIDIIDGNLVGTLEESTAEEYNNATNF